MTLRMFAPLVAAAIFLAACSGGSTPGTTSNTALLSSNRQIATGTLTIGLPQSGTSSNARSAASNTRKPAYVSASTTYATLWIDASVTGTRVLCNGQAGQCTINWTSTAGSHTFAVAIDDSSSAQGGGNVLAENSVVENLEGGPNTLTMTLNGVVGSLVLNSESLFPAGDNADGCYQTNCFAIIFYALDLDGNTITSPGNFDGAPLYVLWTGTVLANEGFYTGNATANGQQAITIACYQGSTGSFSMYGYVGLAGEVSASQLATYTLYDPNQSTLPASNWPSYNCSNGVISATGPANGTITVNAHSNSR